jgi:enoyl-CoA hydratase
MVPEPLPAETEPAETEPAETEPAETETEGAATGGAAHEVTATERAAHEDVLTVTVQAGVALVTLNRPAKLNALTPSLMAELDRQLDRLRAMRELRALILTGAGERAFSVGFDLVECQVASRTDQVVEETDQNFRILMKLWDFPLPTIAAVRGYALGSGASLAWLCDIVIAGEGASFGEPEVKHLALAPMLLLPWMAGNQKLANLLYFTGARLSASEALAAGMVARVVPDAELLGAAKEIADEIAQVPPFGVRLMKQSLRAGYDAMGFRLAQESHRARDELALSAHGIPERDQLSTLLRDGRLDEFLSRRGR